MAAFKLATVPHKKKKRNAILPSRILDRSRDTGEMGCRQPGKYEEERSDRRFGGGPRYWSHKGGRRLTTDCSGYLRVDTYGAWYWTEYMNYLCLSVEAIILRGSAQVSLGTMGTRNVEARGNDVFEDSALCSSVLSNAAEWWMEWFYRRGDILIG